MSGLTCSSRAQCRLNGLFGTAVAFCAAMLAWVAAEGLGGAVALWPALLWLAPTSLSVLLWAALRATGRQPGWPAVALVGAGAVWGIVMLNGLERL